MNLSKQTVDILKNYSTINSSIAVDFDDVIKSGVNVPVITTVVSTYALTSLGNKT